MLCNEKKKKNSYRRKGGVRPEHNSMWCLHAARSRTKEADRNQVCSRPFDRREIPTDVITPQTCREWASLRTAIIKHTHTLSLSHCRAAGWRLKAQIYLYTTWRWLNRHTVLGFTGSSDAFPVLREKKRKKKAPEGREKERRAESSITCQCLRHEKNNSSYLWSPARVPLCIQLLFTFFYLLMQPFISMSNTAAWKK